MDTIADVESREIICANGMPATLALPRGVDKAPVLVVLHERYGYVKHPKDLAKRAAREGYVGIAPNMFHKYADQASIARGDHHYDMTDPESVELMAGLLETLPKEAPQADMKKLAVVGFCQTGRHAMVLAAALPFGAALIWYGGAAKKSFEVNEMYPEPLEKLIEKIKCPIHAVYGETCHTQPLEDVRALRNCFERHNKSFKIIVAANAPHGFLNDTMPGRYAKEQAEAGWASQRAFLENVFSPNYDSSRLVQIYEADVGVNYDFSKNIRRE